jgi:hypothetical protein
MRRKKLQAPSSLNLSYVYSYQFEVTASYVSSADKILGVIAGTLECSYIGSKQLLMCQSVIS